MRTKKTEKKSKQKTEKNEQVEMQKKKKKSFASPTAPKARATVKHNERLAKSLRTLKMEKKVKPVDVEKEAIQQIPNSRKQKLAEAFFDSALLFKVGDDVKCHKKKGIRGPLAHGKVTSLYKDGTYKVKFKDGVERKHVCPSRMHKLTKTKTEDVVANSASGPVPPPAPAPAVRRSKVESNNSISDANVNQLKIRELEKQHKEQMEQLKHQHEQQMKQQQQQHEQQIKQQEQQYEATMGALEARLPTAAQEMQYFSTESWKILVPNADANPPHENVIPALTPPRPAGLPILRVLSWNCLHLSAKTGSTVKAMAALRRVICQGDFIALQEIDDEEIVKSIVKEMSSTETEWKFCQKRISTGRGRGSSECYAFIWRDSVLELVSDAYIVAQEGGNGSGAEFYFHRPPMLATFRVKPSGMVFTAATIHLTFSGRKEWEPTGEEARILELKNVAAVAAKIEDVYDGVIDRIMFLGDFNLPARCNYFEDLIGALGYTRSLDPDVWVSMTSKIDMLPTMQSAEEKEKRKKRERGKRKLPKDDDKLYDNIFLSPPLRQGAAENGGKVEETGVINLMDLMKGSMREGWDMGVPDKSKLEMKLKKLAVRTQLSDHLPIFCDLSLVTKGVPYKPIKKKVKVGISLFARDEGDNRIKIGQKYKRVDLVGQ
eukprot:g5988.t1